jgi:hypothetical protein
MSMALLAALAAATTVVAPGSAADTDEGAAFSACRDLAAHADDLGPMKFRRLSELPPGVLVHAVYRMVQGCPVAEVLVKGERYYVPSVVRREDGPATRAIRRDSNGH